MAEETERGQGFKGLENLVDLFVGRGVSLHAPKITTCYFGVGAATAALEIAGLRTHASFRRSLIDYADMTDHLHPVR